MNEDFKRYIKYTASLLGEYDREYNSTIQRRFRDLFPKNGSQKDREIYTLIDDIRYNKVKPIEIKTHEIKSFAFGYKDTKGKSGNVTLNNVNGENVNENTKVFGEIKNLNDKLYYSLKSYTIGAHVWILLHNIPNEDYKYTIPFMYSTDKPKKWPWVVNDQYYDPVQIEKDSIDTKTIKCYPTNLKGTRGEEVNYKEQSGSYIIHSKDCSREYKEYKSVEAYWMDYLKSYPPFHYTFHPEPSMVETAVDPEATAVTADQDFIRSSKSKIAPVGPIYSNQYNLGNYFDLIEKIGQDFNRTKDVELYIVALELYNELTSNKRSDYFYNCVCRGDKSHSNVIEYITTIKDGVTNLCNEFGLIQTEQSELFHILNSFRRKFYFVGSRVATDREVINNVEYFMRKMIGLLWRISKRKSDEQKIIKGEYLYTTKFFQTIQCIFLFALGVLYSYCYKVGDDLKILNLLPLDPNNNYDPIEIDQNKTKEQINKSIKSMIAGYSYLFKRLDILATIVNMNHYVKISFGIVTCDLGIISKVILESLKFNPNFDSLLKVCWNNLYNECKNNKSRLSKNDLETARTNFIHELTGLELDAYNYIVGLHEGTSQYSSDSKKRDSQKKLYNMNKKIVLNTDSIIKLFDSIIGYTP